MFSTCKELFQIFREKQAVCFKICIDRIFRTEKVTGACINYNVGYNVIRYKKT